MKRLRIALLVLVAIVAAAAGWIGLRLHSRPSTDQYEHLGHVPPATPESTLHVRFLGVSTLLFRGQGSAVLVDGFFTRPPLWKVALGKIAPDAARIDAALAAAGIDRLDAVVTAHSHYDHAMDAAEVAKRTGAVVVGSPSTANIARGAGLPENRIHVVAGTETLRFGDLSITLVLSQHFPHGTAMGEITAPLVPPVRATEYREGGSFSILVERGGRCSCSRAPDSCRVRWRAATPTSSISASACSDRRTTPIATSTGARSSAPSARVA